MAKWEERLNEMLLQTRAGIIDKLFRLIERIGGYYVVNMVSANLFRRFSLFDFEPKELRCSVLG
jgi:hypothetical protein